jgi:ribosomal protein L37AE/L43A
MKSNALTECPKCGHDYIYDIGHDNWTCGNDNCNHVFKLKSNL